MLKLQLYFKGTQTSHSMWPSILQTVHRTDDKWKVILKIIIFFYNYINFYI